MFFRVGLLVLCLLTGTSQARYLDELFGRMVEEDPNTQTLLDMSSNDGLKPSVLNNVFDEDDATPLDEDLAKIIKSLFAFREKFKQWIVETRGDGLDQIVSNQEAMTAVIQEILAVLEKDLDSNKDTDNEDQQGNIHVNDDGQTENAPEGSENAGNVPEKRLTGDTGGDEREGDLAQELLRSMLKKRMQDKKELLMEEVKRLLEEEGEFYPGGNT